MKTGNSRTRARLTDERSEEYMRIAVTVIQPDIERSVEKISVKCLTIDLLC
jgi:hypothetical protein